MKLYATTVSERGKEVKKGGNEFIHILINDENRENLLAVHIEPRIDPTTNELDTRQPYSIELVNYKRNYIAMD